MSAAIVASGRACENELSRRDRDHRVVDGLRVVPPFPVCGRLNPMTEREPDSGFPGRDTYAKPDTPRKREGTNISLRIAGIIGLLLLIGVFYFLGA
jgi:hypothetical protein